MKKSFLLILFGIMFSFLACGGDSPGAQCCDCLIDNSCWHSSDYACYYYYDDDYSGGSESPPPSQSWGIDCSKTYCTEACKDVEGVNKYF